MLKIDAAQFEALREPPTAAFLKRVQEFAHARLKRPIAEVVVQELHRRGAGYGLASEQELAGYIFMALALQVRPPDADPPWMRDIMARSDWSPLERVRALYRAAPSFVKP